MRNCFSFLLYFVTLSCFISSINSQNNINNNITTTTDSLALLNFKEKVTRDPNGVLNSWNNSTPYCQWIGVQCSKRHVQRVTALRLRSYGLEGSISPYLGNLTFLRTIILKNNSFHSEIPSEIGALFRLRYVDLSNNSLASQLPRNLTKLVNLWYLNLVDNKITGRIPTEVGSLSKLRYLGLSLNYLIGSIPAWLGNLSLIVLSIGGNNLTGTIPDSLGRIHSLEFLQISANRLTGTIPSSIFNLSSLDLLYMYGNQLEGSLPQNMGNSFPRLTRLAVTSNRFTGRIPLSLSNASSLETIYLSNNEFTGPIPKDLSMLKNLRVIELSDNNLGTIEGNDLDFINSLTNSTQLEYIYASSNLLNGPLVSSIANLSTQVRKLEFRQNLIYGNVPPGIENLVNLEVINMGLNRFTGSIPIEIGKLHKLHQLFFNVNKLSGTIPSSLGNLTSLNFLNLQDNNFSGQIPLGLSKLQDLFALVLSGNSLSGPIPKDIMDISSLSMLNLSHNALTGSLPLEVGKLINLDGLDLSNNKLSGPIPSSLSSCVKLLYIDLNGNLFNGEIPQSMASLRGLQYVDLSWNNLSGDIPYFLGKITLLTYLNISYNQLSGEVPFIGIFRNASGVSLLGNNNLCGGIPEFGLPACVNSSPNNGMSRSVKIGIAFGAAVLCSTALVVFAVFYLRRRSRKKLPLAAKETIQLRNEFTRISYSDIQKATEGFSESNLIGSGSFGSVYKGILEANGSVVAIKVLNLYKKGAAKSFISECIALKNIRHRNLVKVLNACSSLDFQGNEFKALVFEYMLNGNLDEWLHSINNCKSLTLLQRLNIAFEVAEALEYLHCQNESIIVHSDLKPSNILLDEDMVAHLGDFGLTKIISPILAFESNQTSSTIPLKGSIGYIPPEYGTSGNVTTHGDVYSYGIVLLEMFTGRRPTDTMFINGLTLRDFVNTGLAEQTPIVLDPILVAEANERRTGKNVEYCCFAMLNIGMKCSMELAKERMDIQEVVSEICSIKEFFLKSRV